MERRRLGAVEVSRIILGCGNFGGIGSAPQFFGQGESEEEAFRIMDAAWSLGITMFDTADAYGGGRSETSDFLSHVLWNEGCLALRLASGGWDAEQRPFVVSPASATFARYCSASLSG